MNLLPANKIPDWFRYPNQFLRIINQNLTDLDPWYILLGEELNVRYEGLKSRYPGRDIIPFAKDGGSDDVACWDKSDLSKVYIIHDYATAGFEQRKVYEGFWDWFRAAIEATIEHDL